MYKNCSQQIKTNTIFFVCLPQKIPLNKDSVAVTRALLHSTVESFVREVAIEEIHEQISDLAVEVVKDLQEISLDVVHNMRAVVTQVRELRNDKTLKKYARNIMKDALITSRVVMDFVNELDAIIKLLKIMFMRTKT